MDHTYISITRAPELRFSGCAGCLNSCCDGSRFLFSPLILEDFAEVYTLFPIVFAKIQQRWRPLIRLAQEGGGCRYHTPQGCAIYDRRPPGCRLYPFSPYYEDLLIDTSCSGVGTHEGVLLVCGNRINTDFYHTRLENFETKRQKSEARWNRGEGDYTPLGTFGGIELFRYVGEEDDYARMHRESLALYAPPDWRYNASKTKETACVFSL